MIETILEPLNHTLFTLFGAPTSVAELLGFITGAWCVWLVAKQNIWTFPIGIANAFFFMILFYDAKLYADGTLQIVYFLLNAFGWFAWLKLGPNRSELLVSRSSRQLLLMVLGFVVVTTAGMTVLLEHLNDSAPFLDALTTALSLAAQFLLSLKKIENWILWIIADLIYIPLYVHKDLVLTGIVYCLFLAICCAGLYQWNKSYKTTNSKAPMPFEPSPEVVA